MPIIPERDKPMLRNRLSKLRFPVRILCFIHESGYTASTASRVVHDLLMELKGFSPMIDVETCSIEHHPERVSEYGVTLLPTIVLCTEHGPGIRFSGIPKEYELATLIEAIELVGLHKIDLQPTVVHQLEQIIVPVSIKVFVTPSSPYCPAAISTACRLAMASKHIHTDIIDISTFPDVAERYGVHGVPRVVINEDVAFEGSLPDDLYVEEILHAVAVPTIR